MNFRTSAVRLGLLPSAIAMALIPAVASAQDAPRTEEPATLDRIEVTGSRIRQADMETSQPVMTISREDIQNTGLTTVADILQNLTSAGSPAISRGDVLASGENVGGYYVDLRNLGASRTLILVNGRRLGANTTGLQDLGQIPASAIQRIDVLKDGASSIYGSDAIAGVVNVITRTRFDGAEANVYFGQYGQGDGSIQTFDATIGHSGDRGGVTLSVEYGKEDPVWAKDRWYSADGSLGPDFPGAGWSPVSQQGLFIHPDSGEWMTLRPGEDPSDPASYRPYTEDDYANSNQQMMARTGMERRSIYAAGEFDFTDNIRLVGDALYNHRTTTAQSAGYPFQSGAFGIPLSGESAVNPFPGTELQFMRRLWEMPRATENELSTYRVSGALQGVFEIGERYWDWEVGGSWNRNEMLKSGRGDGSLPAMAAALGPSFVNADGQLQCGTPGAPIAIGTNLGAGECMPWSPLQPYGADGAGNLGNSDLQAFLFPYYHDRGLTESTTYNATLSGSLFAMPAGDLGMAVGYEHRKETGRFVPDAFNQAGLNTGLPATTTQGSYSLDEMFLEFNVPLLADMPGAQELSLNLATRYSDYDTFGDTLNNKFGLTWRPTEDLLVRGTYAEGFRAPSIDNLYGGVGGSFESYTDPCGNGPGNVAGNAACTAAGVPADFVQLGQGLIPCDSFPCQTPNQFLSGSNPDLTPEEATSKTAGIVYSPRWIDGFDISLDWYKVEINNLIASDSVSDILTDCYVRGIDERCGTIVRDADTHVITALNFALTNKGRLETEGYDLGVRYQFPETTFGNFLVDWQTSYVSKYTVLANDNPDTVPAPSVSFGGTFRTRSNLTLDWDMGDFGASWTARYYSGMKEGCVVTDDFDDNYCNLPDYVAPDVPDGLPLRSVGSNTFHDVQVRWDSPWDSTISVGANNVTNHRGPLMFSSPNNQYPYYGGFDIGRFVYMKYQQRF